MAPLPTALEPTSDLDRLRPQIDAALEGYAQFDEGCPEHLAEAIRYALLAPGKRLRPQLVLLAAEACGTNPSDAMPAACAVEMIHAYSLVHDDLPAMDDDDLRRGRPTCHKVYDEATAILVGDALLALAFEVLARDIRPPACAAQCCAELGHAAGATALVGGQAADMAGEQKNANGKQLASIHRRKTGALFVASLRLGGIVAGASPEQLAALETYGREVGLAFQITDDLLDVSGDEAELGKRVAKDARHGKITFPQLLGIPASREQATKLIDQACAAIELLGPKGEPLTALAKLVLHRNR